MNMDQVILQAFPLLAAPADGILPRAPSDGMRYVAAKDGVWREVTLPWIKVRHKVADSVLELPYGGLEGCIDYQCGSVPREAIRQFVEEARVAAPNEIAAALIWNEVSNEWRYARRQELSASPDRIEYVEVRLGEDEHLVVDIHSHGWAPAFFSSTDDADDRGAMKISLVLGNLDRNRPSSAMRLCMAGFVRPVTMSADGVLEQPA